MVSPQHQSSPSYSATLSVLRRIGTMLCPTPPQQQQPQSLQALARSRSLCLRQSQSRWTSQRCRSLNYNSENDADYSPDFSIATIEFMIRGLNSLNINLSMLPLPSVSPHADTDQDELDNVPRMGGSDDSNLSDSLLSRGSPRISTDYDELGNLASEVSPSGSNPTESLAIDIGSQDEHNDFGQPHHRTRVTCLELTFMLVGFNLEILSAGFDQVSSTSKPCYALISLLLAIAAVFTCIWELIYNGIKERDASPNSTVFGIVVRRVIPSDNSCLFNAVGYVMDHDKKKAHELRQVIAATVASDPTKYSEAFLGKPNEEYCAWILDSEKWGGAIELSILADYYGREIAAYDIQTTRCDLYGQEKKYSERSLLIYDGLHYDALAMSPFEGAPEEFDQTIFAVRDSTIGPVEGLALNLVKEQQSKRRYTDTANFTLRCGVCQLGLVGQKEAVEHARATGHVNFQEYR
ncbi:unnamed protein product [Prunus brigantina]